MLRRIGSGHCSAQQLIDHCVVGLVVVAQSGDVLEDLQVLSGASSQHLLCGSVVCPHTSLGGLELKEVVIELVR